MYCSHCGSKNEENSKFCSSCGKELIKVKEQNKQDFQNLKKKETKDDIDSFLNDLGIS